MTKRAPIHPGYILETEFLDELGLSAYALAKALRVPLNRITGIVKGKRAITADTALRLARTRIPAPSTTGVREPRYNPLLRRRC
jgi:addiction module HigA family antidote